VNDNILRIQSGLGGLAFSNWTSTASEIYKKKQKKGQLLRKQSFRASAPRTFQVLGV
jgi:hypothetical protein